MNNEIKKIVRDSAGHVISYYFAMFIMMMSTMGMGIAALNIAEKILKLNPA